ncbi:MAG TPA: excinuclease ABC subunit UvrB [Verrucomicrobiae bacterium]|nr:excinuclease ABC subunit UvrB [Verrucomicrobiae bacterium]
MKPFELKAPFEPTGDQPTAIKSLVTGLKEGANEQVLLGVTGSGKTFTIANIIQEVQRPTLVMAHNKTLAAQLFAEFREFFPNNSVQYFVSYYDYYQPEAYIPRSDTFIEKEADINQEIEKFRHASTHALLTRRDVIIVASVSCIYGLGSPDLYRAGSVKVQKGERISQTALARRLSDVQFERNDVEVRRGKFSIKGDTLTIFPSYDDFQIRITQFGDEVEEIALLDPVTMEVSEKVESVDIFPAKHYLTDETNRMGIVEEIRNDMEKEVAALQAHGKIVEAQRLQQRTTYDLEMITETGTVQGIENYSRYFDRRTPGSPPSVLLDYFPDDFLLVVDESHITIPQIGGMYRGDQARKQTLVDYGFRLNAAKDNRPLTFEEFQGRHGQTIFVSATPSQFELEKARAEEQRIRLDKNVTLPLIAQQLIRPTGILDPEIEVRPVEGQITNLLEEIKIRVERKERTLVTTLTKRMAEDVTEYFLDKGIKVQYLHSDVETLERSQILQDLRLGIYDVLVGINLLREGLDLPEVSLVAILDADKEGFLRSETSLVQTIGRAARHPDGKVYMYADRITGSMERAINETNRRRGVQQEYNTKHGIVPVLMMKPINVALPTDAVLSVEEDKAQYTKMNSRERAYRLEELREQMRQAALALEFEKAAELRDHMKALQDAA